MPPKPRAKRELPSSNRITRKQATNPRPEDNTDEPAVVALSKKRKNPPVEPDEEEGSEEALEDIDVSGKRSRTRLLQLLDNHITKKKARHSKKKAAKKKTCSGVVENNDVTVQSPAVTSDTILSTEVNYNKFNKHELEEILRDVGIDTSGMDQDRLVETCEFYKDLIVLPTSLVQQEPKVPIQSTSQIGGQQASFTFEVTSKEVDKDLRTGPKELSESSVRPPGGSTGDIIVDEPSDTFIPSLEHGRLRYPRPQPTSLEQSLPSTSNKGKEREQVQSDAEYVPEDDEMSDIEGAGTNRNQKSRAKGGVPPDVNSDGETSNKETPETGFSKEPSTESWRQMKGLLLKANRRIDFLECELRRLSEAVKRSMGNEGQADAQAKPGGGRTAAHIRFHVEMMFGLKSESDPLPPPASTEEQERWDCELDLERVEIDLQQPSEPFDQDPRIDLCFPYPGGPGHQKATRQQLSVTWQLMKAAGIKSFRPNLAGSPSSKQNKRVWNLSEKIFFKLVRLGIYSGVSLDPDNVGYIKKCFSTHIQSLMKRYRQQNWTNERKEAATRDTRQATRLCRLRKMRTTIVLQEERLWPLLPLVEVACSDDETDVEEGQLLIPSKGPICARKLSWRSAALEKVLLRLDGLKLKQDQSLPGNSSSPQRGRPARPRIRRDNATESLIEAPDGLSRYCYSSSFLEEIGEKGELMWNMSPECILSKMVQVLDSL